MHQYRHGDPVVLNAAAQTASGGTFTSGTQGFIFEVGSGLNAGTLVVQIPGSHGDVHVVVKTEHVDYVGTEATDGKPEA